MMMKSSSVATMTPSQKGGLGKEGQKSQALNLMLWEVFLPRRKALICIPWKRNVEETDEQQEEQTTATRHTERKVDEIFRSRVPRI